MKPKLLKTGLGQYEPAKWTGKNESGGKPIGSNVLILPDQAALKTAGGIELPDDLRERTSMAAESGVLVANGPAAWRYDRDGRQFEGDKPEPGTRVCFEKYAGALHHGADGLIYRVMSDHCVSMVET